MTIATNLVAENNENLFSHRSRGQKFEISIPGIMQSAGPSCLQRLHGTVCSLPLPASGGCWLSLTCGYITALSASVATRSPPLPSAWNPPLPSFPLALKHKIHQFQGLISSEDILQPTTLGICIYPSVFKCHWLKTALRVLGASWLPRELRFFGASTGFSSLGQDC